MKKTGKFLLNTILLTASSLFLSTVSMSFNVYISKKIGSEAMGIFQLVMSVYMLMVTFSISGSGMAVTRLVSEELATGHEKGAVNAVKKCLIYAICFGTAACAVLFFSAEFIGLNILRSPLTVRPLYTLALSLPFLSASCVISGYFIAVRRVVKNVTAQIFEQFLKITLSIYFLNIFLPDGLEAACFSIILGGTLSEILSAIYIFILYVHDKKRYKRSALNGENITGRMLYIALPIALSSYLRSALSTVKQIITPLSLEKSGVSSKAAISQYGLIRGMVMPVIMYPSCFLYAFSSLLIPEMSRFYITGNYKSINYAVDKIFKITLLFSILSCGVIFAYSSDLGMHLYKNSQTGYYIKIFSLLIPVMYFDAIVDGFLKGLNKQVSVVKINVLDSAVTVLLTWLLLPVYGISGYITVIFISEFLNAFLSIDKLLKTAQCRVDFINWIIKPVIAIIISIFVGKLFNGLYLSISVSVIFYMLSIYILGSVNRADFNLKNTL